MGAPARTGTRDRRPGPAAGKRLSHAKLLLFGELFRADDNADYWTHVEETFFEATSVWWGSANITGPSENLEVGFDDAELLRWAEGFMDDLLAFSEPADSPCAGPEPNVLPVEWDDAAMTEYAAETRPAVFETEAEMRAGGVARQPIASA